ncbi:hypothetical protein SSX86_030143 [Deinandra increscens subsp. villosa]|uniref:Uncharacterized protein n=1 Tax=Deinandra increscens subsp. villosa TaxID=3103831 RepID=A0AAP0CAX4_9ASTR
MQRKGTENRKFGELEEECAAWDSISETRVLSEEERLLWGYAKNDLFRLEEERRVDLAQKSRSRWAALGDDNTAYFHGYLKHRAVSNRINGIQVGNEWVSEPEQIKEHARRFFEILAAIDSAMSVAA